MFQQLSDSPTPACNDNGTFFRHGRTTAMPSGSMLKAASETLGPICLSYVAQGVFIISSQEPTTGRVDVAALARHKHSLRRTQPKRTRPGKNRAFSPAHERLGRALLPSLLALTRLSEPDGLR